MDNNQEQVVDNLKKKFDTVVDLLDKSEEERKKLIKEKRELTEQLKYKTVAYKELKKKYDALKIAKAIAGSESDRNEAKSKVNRIVREIDKCIALLNR